MKVNHPILRKEKHPFENTESTKIVRCVVEKTHLTVNYYLAQIESLTTSDH